MRQRFATFLVLLCVIFAVQVRAQDADSEARDATREKLRELLESAGDRDDVNVSFHQSTKEPYNFTGTMKDRLSNVESLEIVLRVTSTDTINLRVFPHYKGGYINLNKLKDERAFLRQLAHYNDSNFLYWGADDSDDVFTGYTVTLESGFPEEALTIVLRSIRATDRFVGELRKSIDGSSAAKSK